jgi:citrate synthase
MERLRVVAGHVQANVRPTAPLLPSSTGAAAQGSTRDTVTVTDNRTGKSVELDISNNTIRAADLKKVIGPDGAPLKTFDRGI